MQTSKFIQTLENNLSKKVLFEYQQNQFVPKSYHLTEVKNVHIESVDCGGFAHSEDQTIVQLWIDPNEAPTEYMTAEKMLKIIQLVDKVKSLKGETPLFFEWGMQGLATSNYRVEKIDISDENIQVKMSVPPTVCRPKVMDTSMALPIIGGCGTSNCC